MFVNFLKVALRNFQRQPGYTLLNILGLTIGVAATLIILMYISEETGYDSYHEKADRIYRISSDIKEPDNAFKWAVTQFPLAPTLQQEFPEVEQYVRFIPNGRTRYQKGAQQYYDEKTFFADSTVLEVFSFELVAGNRATALQEPNSILLNQSLAQKIFGKTDIVGEMLEVDELPDPLQVTGVYQDMPRHSHLIAHAMISSNTLPFLRQNPDAGNWGSFNIYSYVLLRPGEAAAALESKLQQIIDKYVAVIFDEFNINIKYEMIALTDIHLKSDFDGEPEPSGDMAFVYIFGAVGLFMLLIACINYMNLSTARSARRAMEVGMRKVLGSSRQHLVAQFLSESLLFTFIALIFSLVLVFTLLPLINGLFDLHLDYNLLLSPQVLTGMLGILILVGILGGSYPAFFLSAFQPITVLKGGKQGIARHGLMRKGLVVVQFAISLFMLIGTGIIYDQMHYLRTKELGFDREQLLTFEINNPDARQKWPVLREAILQNPNITSVGTASTTPGSGFSKNVMTVEMSDGTMDQLGVDFYAVDYDFFTTLGTELVDGRYFSESFATDSTAAVLVNEAMVRRMNWSEPIGRKIQFGVGDTLPVLKVIGVLADFHQRSLYNPIEALVFIPRLNNRMAHIRIRQDIPGTIAFLENEYREVFPESPFEYNFVDESLMALYEADQIRSRIFTLFSCLMIFIACLGLLGLASYTAEQKTKEIGIRKIVGASVPNIVLMLTRNFIFLVLLAALPAFLAGWYFMSKWLDTFSYHTQMNYLVFGLALFLTAFITLITTGYHAYRAASTNPVKALRYE